MYLRLLFLLFPAALLFSCSENKKKQSIGAVYSKNKDTLFSQTKIKYSKGFDIEYHQHYKVIRVKDPEGKQENNFQYVLYYDEGTKPKGVDHALFVKVPVKKFVALSTLYVGYSEKLKLSKNMIGMADIRFVNSPSVREMISEGKIAEVEGNNNINIEKILELDPGLIITYGSIDPSDDVNPKLTEAGLKVAVTSEQMEASPLGRTEWIKFFAAFFNKDREADSIFKGIEEKYLAVAALASKAKERPSVFTDIKYGDTWFVPGGSSHMANLLEDANTHYLWADNDKKGALPLSFETVYEKAINADFWINASDFKTLKAMADSDVRYKDFKAYRTGNIFNNNNRVNEAGGNDYWESGIVSPDVILSDLVKIFHPDLLPGYELAYYKKLGGK